MARICLYYRPLDPDRWFKGDRHLRAWVRRLVRGKPRAGGIGRVFLNLCEGLRRIGAEFSVNPPFSQIMPDDQVVVLGIGRDVLLGYDRPNPIVAGIALLAQPADWPTLFEDYPVATYLQHSAWAADLYRPYFGDRCGVWPVGIDTGLWAPADKPKSQDFVLYLKTDEVPQATQAALTSQVTSVLTNAGLTFSLIRYGHYREEEYRAALSQARGMIFLSPHESQGLACEECLACDVPVLAWDPGITVERPAGYEPTVSTSVPYFDERCGVRFKSPEDFGEALKSFIDGRDQGRFAPRKFILESLTLEKAASHMCAILDAANRPNGAV